MKSKIMQIKVTSKASRVTMIIYHVVKEIPSVFISEEEAEA